MALLNQKAIRKFFGLSQSEEVVRNAVNEAFLLGGTYTKYDGNAPTYVRKGYLYNPVVYAITKQRSDKAVSIPRYIKEVTDDNNVKRLKNLQRTVSNGYTPGQYVKEISLKQASFKDDFVPFPMERPNELQTWDEIVALYETFMPTTGNFYLYMLRGEITGIPAAVYVLPSHLIKIVLKPKASTIGLESPIDSYMLIEGNQYVEFKADDVIHIKLPNPNYTQDGNHLYGLSPLSSALRNLQSSNLNIDGNIRAALNSGAFGFIHGKNAVLNDRQVDQIKREMQRMDMGDSRLSKISGSSAELGFTQIGLTPQELELLALLNYDQKQLANVLGWDDILLNNDQGAKYDNYELALKSVVTRTTMPSLSLFEEAINSKFLPLFKGYENTMFMFDYSELPEMQPDMKSLVEWLNIGVANGAYNRDEFRRMTNFAILGTPEMEAHTVNNDIILLEEAIANDFSLSGQEDIQATMVNVS